MLWTPDLKQVFHLFHTWNPSAVYQLSPPCPVLWASRSTLLRESCLCSGGTRDYGELVASIRCLLENGISGQNLNKRPKVKRNKVFLNEITTWTLPMRHNIEPQTVLVWNHVLKQIHDRKERLFRIRKTTDVFLTLNPFMWVRIFPVV